MIRSPPFRDAEPFPNAACSTSGEMPAGEIFHLRHILATTLTPIGEESPNLGSTSLFDVIVINVEPIDEEWKNTGGVSH